MNYQPSLITKPVVAYYRRSQDKRGQKHSIEAQQMAVGSFCKSNNLEIVAEYQDTASGKNDNREGLLQAVAHAKQEEIPLVVLRVDRLGRKLSTLATYFEDNSLSVIVAELGMTADFLTLSVLSCVASANVRTLSKRTKEGLAVVRAKGIQLGNPTPERSLALCKQSNLKRGQDTANKYGELISNMRDNGLSYNQISDSLNEMNVPSPSKRGAWNKGTVYRLIKRFSANA